MHKRAVKKPMLTIGEAVTKSTGYLRDKGVDSPRLDAELLLCQVLATDRLHLYMDWQKPLTELEVSGYREYIRRRGQEREPVARIVGHREFYRRNFEVTAATFVPRQETEGLVERALMLLQQEEALKNTSGAIFEVGTGTGCIVVTMAAENGSHHYICSDLSEGALETAKRNAKRHHVAGRIEFRLGAGFCGYGGALLMIVSNPPYIPYAEIEGLMPEVAKHDPLLALDGGTDGLDAVRMIVEEGTGLLVAGGWVVLELDCGQPEHAAELFRATGRYDRFLVEKDFAGLDRYLIVRRAV